MQNYKNYRQEQLRFKVAMLAAGVFYQTKRGDEIPPKYRVAYLHTKPEKVGKLCLAAIASRSNLQRVALH